LILGVKVENKGILFGGFIAAVAAGVLKCFLDEVVRIASDDLAGLSIARRIVQEA
jgi:hypothetical protein